MDIVAVLVIIVVAFAIAFAIAWIPILLKRMIQRLLARGAEKRLLRRSAPIHFPQDTPDTSKLFRAATVLPIPAAIGLAIFAEQASPIFRYIRETGITEDAFGLSFAAVLFTLPAYLLVPVVVWLHYSRTGGRRLKYDLVLTALTLALVLGGYAGSGIKSWGGSWHPSLGFALVIGLLWWWWPLFVLAQFLTRRLIERAAAKGRLRRWFYIFQNRLWWFLAVLYTPLFIVYWLVRFHVIDHMARRPVLYFRSFRQESGPASFSKIVTKAVRRHGVIEGLVTSAQRSTDLQESVHPTEQAHFSATSDATWREWVESRLRVASVVIVDMTTTSESLEWEVAQSMQHLGASRIAVMYSGERPAIPEGVLEVPYDLTRKGARKAHKALGAWLKSLEPRALEVNEETSPDRDLPERSEVPARS